jgi:FkbM family methyltransferase
LKLSSIKFHLDLARKEIRESRAREREWYPSNRDWIVRIYDRLLRRIHWFRRMPLRKRVTRVRFKALDRPFYVRLGSSDLQLHQTITYRGEYRPLFERELGPIRQVVDLGANAGFTIRLWRDRFPEARVIAVEPDESNLNMCRLNADAAGGGDKVQLVRACVDGKPGTVLLDRSGLEQLYHITSQPTGDCVEVPAKTVQQILDECSADPVIDLLKCDIQGAERAVFADCALWIHRVRHMVVELHDPYTKDEFLADLARAGWRYRECIVHRTDVLWVLFLFGDAAPEDAAGESGQCSVSGQAAHAT